MTTTVTIIRDGVTNAYGLPLVKGASYPLDDAFAAGLVQQLAANYTGVRLLANPPFENIGDGAVPGLILNDASVIAATFNTTAIQAALNVGGLVQITQPGTYYINSTLTLYDDTWLQLGVGVVVKLLNNISQPLLQNSNKASTAITISNQITCGSPSNTAFCTATADCGANAHGFSVGNWVLIKYDTSNQYNGVVQVLTTPTAFTFTFRIHSKSAFTISTGTPVCKLANNNIRVSGGTWDYNGLNNPYVTGVRAQGFLLNNIGLLRIDNLNYINGTKWFTNIGNAWGVQVSNIELNTGSDGVHMSGNCNNVLISGIRGQTGDDMIVFEAYPESFVANEGISGGDQIGGLFNCVIRDIQCTQTSENVINIAPDTSYEVSNLLIDGVECLGSCKALVYMPAVTNGVVTAVKDVTIRNLKAKTYTSNAIKIGSNATSYAIDNLVIDGLEINSGTSVTTQLINLQKCQIGTMRVNGVKFTIDVTSGTSRYGIDANDSSVTIGNLVLSNWEVKSSGSGSSAQIVAINGSSAATWNIECSNINLSGSVHMLAGGGASTTVNMMLVNSFFDAYFIVANSGVNALKIEASNLKCRAPGGNAPFSLNGTSKTYSLRLSNIDFGNATNWLLGGTSSTYHLNVGGLRDDDGSNPGISYGTTNTFFIASWDPFFTIKTDTAGHTFTPRTGAIYNDTQAALPGIYVRGPTTTTKLTA